jgi:hypothetical protein
MTPSQNAGKKGESHAHPQPQQASAAGPVEEFGRKIISDDFARAEQLLRAHGAEGEASQAHHARYSDILLIEIETRLEADDAKGAVKCLELLRHCAPQREEEARMWFGDYHMGRLEEMLTAGGIASFGSELESLLKFSPERQEEAYELIAHYYMKKLRRAIDQQRGSAVETAALRELLRYAPARKEEAYNLFADRCMDEMKHYLEEHDKEYAKLSLEGVAKYAPKRKAEAMAIWERHMEASKERKLYGILGVERNATDEEIRLAYRRLAKELHPDVNSEHQAQERMKHVNAAYTILGDPELRSRYDQRGDRRSMQ